MMISFEQAFGVALHGIGQAMIASSASGGAGWMQNESLLVKEGLKISQALLAVQITLVSLQRWFQVLQTLTVFSALYSATLAAFYFRNYPHLHYLALSGALLMAIGSLLFGFGSSGRRRPQPALKSPKEILGPLQKKAIARKKPSTKPEFLQVHSHQGNKHEISRQTRKSPFETLATAQTTSSLQQPLPISHTTMPATPTAEMGNAAVLPHIHDHNLLATVSKTPRITGTPSMSSTVQTVASLAPAITTRHGSAYSHSSDHRVATAFQRDPFEIDLRDTITQINDTDDETQVFSPGYFANGRPNMENKTKLPSTSSSLEIVEEVNGEPYILYYSEDE